MNKVGIVALLSCLIYSCNALLEIISRNACFDNLENINDTDITIDFADGFPKKSLLYYETVPLPGPFMKHDVQIFSRLEIVSDFHMRVLENHGYPIAKLTTGDYETISEKLPIDITATMNMTIENTGETVEVTINNQRFEMLQALPALNKEISIRITGIKIPKICYFDSASTPELSQPVEDFEAAYPIHESCLAFNGSDTVSDNQIPSMESDNGFRDGTKVSIKFSMKPNGHEISGFLISIFNSDRRQVFHLSIMYGDDMITCEEVIYQNSVRISHPKAISYESFEPNDTIKFDLVRKDKKFLMYVDNSLLSAYTPAFLANYNDNDFALTHFTFSGDVAIETVCYNNNNDANNTVFDPNRMLDTITCKHNVENLDIYEMLVINLPKKMAENQSLFLYAKTKPNHFILFMFTLHQGNHQSALHVDFGMNHNHTYVWSKYQGEKFIAKTPLFQNKEFVLEIANAHGEFKILVDGDLIATSNNSEYTAESFSIYGSAKVNGLCLDESSSFL